MEAFSFRRQIWHFVPLFIARFYLTFVNLYVYGKEHLIFFPD